MSVFDGKRLTQDTLQLDLDGLRRGIYSDKYFENIRRMLSKLASEGYNYSGSSPRLNDVQHYNLPDAKVEMQIFTRRDPFALVGGMDAVTTMLKHCTGYWDDGGGFVNTAADLEVDAVQDGVKAEYQGDLMHVTPVLKIYGTYRYFAHLETTILGYLTRISRIATNVYHVLVAAQGKNVLFFPARFDLPDVQAAGGYAYWLAVQRYNHDYSRNVRPFISTDAQGRWWGGQGGGTVPHAVIAVFLADTAESMVQYAHTQSIGVPRIALVDFENDCVNTSLAVAKAMFDAYRYHHDNDNPEMAKKYKLDGVRLDTSGQLVDKSLAEAEDHYGVNPALVRAVRDALDAAWQHWNLDESWQRHAQQYCSEIQIVCTGGFNAERISAFERENVPVDTYGVGSALMRNDGPTNTDFSADVVRVFVNNEWLPIAKVGRQPNDNPDLERVSLE
ncbi:MAG: nicotinate phosphoribosyltransferase [Chloroflexi bacterium]|nr:nicotinate phosphoribosyltransferase [Chloroflexota bacterium]